MFLTPSKADDFRQVLKQIEKGFIQNNVKLFADYFNDNCYLSLNNGVSGYYTSSQAYYIFEKYFLNNKIIEYKVNDSSINNNQVIVEVSIKYIVNGITNNGQVLITLKNINNKFLITQFFIS